jgi:hypothetical protein
MFFYLEKSFEMFHEEERKIEENTWEMVSSNSSILVSCVHDMFDIIYGNVLVHFG